MERLVKKDKYIDYEIIRTNKKKDFYLASIKDGVVYMNVPEYADNQTIKMVLSQRFLDLYYKIHADEMYVVHYRGKKYAVKCLKSTSDKVIVNDNEIIIKAVQVTQRYFSSVLYKFFTRVVEEEIYKLMGEVIVDFKEISIPKIVVKKIKGYLGYNYGDHIEISPRIAKYDTKFVKVLLYHELCHSLVHGHPRAFWDVLNSKLENGEELNKEMNNTVFNDYL